MPTASKPFIEGDGAMYGSVPQTRLAAERANAQAARPPVNTERIEAAARELLAAIGEDPSRPGLVDTPRRYAKWWAEFVEYDAGNTETVFDVEQRDQLVVVSGMRVWSLCEHHLLPFWCNVSIGYIATDKLLGLSKFARIAHKHAHKLQVQERLVADIADNVQSILGTRDVAVLAEGEHLCMTMRGVHTPARMVSSVMRGCFRHEPEAREEFLSLCRPVLA